MIWQNEYEIIDINNHDIISFEVSLPSWLFSQLLPKNEKFEFGIESKFVYAFCVTSYLQVTHLLPENQEKNASDDYILLHPGAAQYIWFPDVYIGQFFVTCTILLVIKVKKKISPDFAKALRIPKFMVAPASLRIYRNSTARYATQ